MRQRPLAALLETDDPFSGWTSWDYRIQEAINVMDREVCKSCGNPLWLCHSADGRIDFEVRTGACFAKAEIEKWEKDGNDLKPGEYLYAVPVGDWYLDKEGTKVYEKLPSRREAMQKMV
jgi:hypothetical protein